MMVPGRAVAFDPVDMQLEQNLSVRFTDRRELLQMERWDVK